MKSNSKKINVLPWPFFFHFSQFRHSTLQMNDSIKSSSRSTKMIAETDGNQGPARCTRHHEQEKHCKS